MKAKKTISLISGIFNIVLGGIYIICLLYFFAVKVPYYWGDPWLLNTVIIFSIKLVASIIIVLFSAFSFTQKLKKIKATQLNTLTNGIIGPFKAKDTI